MKINIYGTGINAVKFLLDNRNVEVNAFIEGKSDRTRFMEGLSAVSKEVIRIESAGQTLRKHHTVIASSEAAYWEIKRTLEEQYNLTEFEDFTYYKLFGKKIAVIYGNCHTIPVKEAVQLSKDFSMEYGFYPLRAICDIKSHNGEGLYSKVFERCDLFIHQCVREKNFYGPEYASSLIIRKLKPDCKIIGIPNVYRQPRFLYPQMKSYDNQICWEGYNVFPFRDFYIDQNYKELSVHELADMILDDSLISADEIINQKDIFFEKIRLREQEWDIKILDFLYKNLRYKQLFYDPNHPTDQISIYVARRVLTILGYSSEGMDYSGIYKLDTFEIPIYASVRKALNIEYKVDILRKYNKCSLNDVQMDLLEYIRQYIEWNYPNA